MSAYLCIVCVYQEDAKEPKQRQKRLGYSGRKGGPYVQPAEMQ
jgi:hypothetical protein